MKNLWNPETITGLKVREALKCDAISSKLR